MFYDKNHSIQLIKDSTALYNLNPSSPNYGKLNGINTWKDWGLIPTSRPTPNPPGVKTNYIDIPGANGSIDASTVLTSYPVYNNRGLSQEFQVVNNGESGKQYGSWEERYTTIMEYCHGQNMKVILKDDASYYYRGRVGVNNWKSDKDWSKITLDFNLEPFKYSLFDSTDEWLWDPFRFTDGIITHQSDYLDVIVQRTNPRKYAISCKSGTSVTTEYFDQAFDIDALAMPVVCTLIVEPREAIDATNSWIRVVRLRDVGASGGATIRVDKTYKFTTQEPRTIRMYDIKFINELDKIYIAVGSGKSFKITMRYRNGRL